MFGKSSSIVIVLIAAAVAGWSQESDAEIIGVLVPRAQQDALNRLELAKSRGNYPVTPGDIYALAYRSAGKDSSNEILVESDYTLNLNVFGKMKGEGLSFPQLKLKVEKIINDAYPSSLPYLSIKSVGMFQVYLKGELLKTQFVTAWGLSRLSEIVLPNLAANSSIRDIVVEPIGERRKSYDLFKAIYKGAIEEDPFVKLGDTIVIGRRGRQIELQGEVPKPGTYQLLPQDSLKEVIEYYGGGYTALADQAHTRLRRIIGEIPQTFYLDLRGIDGGIERLEDGDVLTIPSKLDRLPMVAFEGAVVPKAETPSPVVPLGEALADPVYGRITHAFAIGETLEDALSAVKESISPAADLGSAYMLRTGEAQIIPLNVSDLLLEPGDRIVIPPYRFYVSVVGAVPNPGSYPYMPQRNFTHYLTLAGGIPAGIETGNVTIVAADGSSRSLDAAIQPEDRIIVTETLIPVSGGVYDAGAYPFVPNKTYKYYISLAGGINPEMNGWNWVTIRSSEGKRRNKMEPIRPGDRVYVHTNDFLYNFNRYFPVITSSAALVTAVLTIINFASR